MTEKRVEKFAQSCCFFSSVDNDVEADSEVSIPLVYGTGCLDHHIVRDR